MPQFYFTQLSVSYLAQVILTLSFTVYVGALHVRSTKRDASTGFLMVSMMGMTGFFFGRFLYKSFPLHTAWQTYALIIQYLSIVVFVLFIIRFAYYVPHFSQRLTREYKIVMVIAVLLSLTAVYNILKLSLIRTSSGSVSFLNLYIGVGYLWTFAVLLRRTYMLADEKDDRSRFQKILYPRTKAGRSTRIYAVAPFMGAVAISASFLYDVGLLTRPISNSLQTVLALMGVAFFALSYLNYAPEDTTIRAKLVGIPLFFVLAILGVLSFWVAPTFEKDYGKYVGNTFPLIEHTIRFSPNEYGGYTAVSSPIQFQSADGDVLSLHDGDDCHFTETSFDFPFYDQTYDHICVSENGFISFEETAYQRAIQYGQLPIIAALLMNLNPDAGGSITLSQNNDRIIVTWKDIPNRLSDDLSSGYLVDGANTFQLILYPNGEIDISYAQISKEQVYGADLLQGAWITGIQSGMNRRISELIKRVELLTGTAYVGGNNNTILYSYQLVFRSYLHDRMMPLMVLVLIASGLILLGIPYMIRVGLVQPIKNLADGMARVDDGDLDVSVSVLYSDEIGRMTHTFNGMVDSIKQADSLKDEFLANTSHELRTPLNGIIGLTESMLAGATGPITAVQAQNLDLIAISGRRLTNLVNDLLDFSKLKHEELELYQRPTDIRAITDLVLMISMPLAQDKELALFNNVPDDFPFACADEDRLQQILHNLIGNAVKFTEAGEIEVSARPFGEFIEVWVRDTGIGIDKAQQDSIFKPFEQVNSSIARTHGGTGLGLSITKKIVEMHGGQLYVESKIGVGTTFRFTLPRCSEEEIEMEKAVRPATGLMSRPISIVQNSIQRKYKHHALTPASTAANDDITLLVVDDEPINLQVLVNYLEPQGYRVMTAASGQEALDMIMDGLLPDLIILDVMMPHMTGYEVCERIRAEHPVQKMPIIMLTARNQVVDLMRGFAAGANDYLTKPFSQEELLTRIRSHMQLAQTNRAYGRFVPDQILEFLNRESIVDVRLGDQIEREMTIMFADVRGFTAISEGMTTKENFAFINALLGRIGPLIRQRGGFIDKYIGDSIMALFPKRADDAVDVAIAIQKELVVFNAERAKTGYPLIKMGIGIHTGMIMLGTIGEEERMEGTVIADAVNTSSRIEALTKHYDVGILISEETLNDLSDVYEYQHRFMDRVKVKGKQGSVSVYEIFEADDLRRKKAAAQAVFEHGARSYHDRDFKTTVSCMKQVLAVLPEDAVTASYLKRAEELLRDGVPDDWDGLARVTGI